jgi:hypothetical protein
MTTSARRRGAGCRGSGRSATANSILLNAVGAGLQRVAPIAAGCRFIQINARWPPTYLGDALLSGVEMGDDQEAEPHRSDGRRRAAVRRSSCKRSCASLDGPVAKAVEKAPATGNVTPVLAYAPATFAEVPHARERVTAELASSRLRRHSSGRGRKGVERHVDQQRVNKGNLPCLPTAIVWTDRWSPLHGKHWTRRTSI